MGECQHIVQSIGWLGETWGFWIQTGALFASAAAAIYVIYYNGKQTRLRALVDLLLHQKSDNDLAEAIRHINQLYKQGNSWAKHLDPECPERKSILLVLNNQELIAVGLRLKIFDEEIYKQMQCSTVLRLWKASQGFIVDLRTEVAQPTLFQDFEQLAKRWEKDPIKKLGN